MQRKLITIDSYASYGDAYGDYLRQKKYDVKHISFKASPSQMFPNKIQILKNELTAIFKLISKINELKDTIVYCRGCHFAVLFLFYLFGQKLKKSHLYLHNFYLHSLGKKKTVKTILTLLLKPTNITLILQHPEEEKYYKKLSKNIKTYFIPYCSDYFPKEYNPNEYSNYIFTGGYTNRDYELVEKLAQQYPQEKFIIVASELNQMPSLSNNITLYKQLPREEFEELLSKSKIVLVPLKDNTGSSGQMLCISAMRNRKPIIYANVPSINYYFTTESGYPYEVGNIESFKDAFQKCIDYPNISKKYGENAYLESLKYTRNIEFQNISNILQLDN